MPEYKAHIIEKIISHEPDLVEIYAEVYSVLKETDPAGLPDSVASELSCLDPPEIIEPSKAAAILKAMLGNTSGDRFSLENCYSISMHTGQSVSSYVGEHLRELGIAYRDFWPYLRDRGWLNE
jgi:hypothetical protein